MEYARDSPRGSLWVSSFSSLAQRFQHLSVLGFHLHLLTNIEWRKIPWSRLLSQNWKYVFVDSPGVSVDSIHLTNAKTSTESTPPTILELFSFRIRKIFQHESCISDSDHSPPSMIFETNSGIVEETIMSPFTGRLTTIWKRIDAYPWISICGFHSAFEKSLVFVGINFHFNQKYSISMWWSSSKSRFLDFKHPWINPRLCRNRI